MCWSTRRPTWTTRCGLRSTLVQRPSVCNAIETLLVHSDIAAQYLPRVLHEMRESGVELRVDGRTRALAGDIGNSLAEATEEDWGTEYHALILSVKVVDSLEEGIEHVNRYGTGHSEAIVTGPRARPRRSRAAWTPRRVRKRVDALHRRRGVRHGRRDRELDTEAARARPDSRELTSQVRGRLRAGPRVAGLRVGILEEHSTRRTSATCVCTGGARAAGARAGGVHAGRRGAAPGDRARPGRRGAARDGGADGGGRRALRGVADRAGAGGPSYTSDTLEPRRSRRRTSCS